MTRTDSPRRGSQSYPPTRPASPSTAVIPAFEDRDKEPSSYEWHEDIRPDMSLFPLTSGSDGTRGVQDGMGGAMGEQGVSYMGLSSGATFLNAIRRLSHRDIFSASPGNSLGLDMAAFLGGLPPKSVDMAKAPSRSSMRIPPLSEVQPLVDSYFKYFREYGGTLRTCLTGHLRRDTNSR